MVSVQQREMVEAGLGEQSRQEPEYTQGAITIEKSIAHESGVCRDRHFGLVLGSCWVFSLDPLILLRKRSFQAHKPFWTSETGTAIFMLRTDWDELFWV